MNNNGRYVSESREHDICVSYDLSESDTVQIYRPGRPGEAKKIPLEYALVLFPMLRPRFQNDFVVMLSYANMDKAGAQELSEGE